MLRNILIVVAAVTIACVLSGTAMAQPTTDPCTGYVGNGCQFGPFVITSCPGWFNCIIPGPFLIECLARNPNCAPPTRADCPYCTQPVSLADGNTWIEEVDARIPGLSGGLTLGRRWNSIWPNQFGGSTGMFGMGWRSTYDERLFVDVEYYIRYSRADGNVWAFGFNGNGWSVASPATEFATLGKDGGTWRLIFKNGETRIFDYNSGSLTTIIDRNGNQTQLTYDALNRLTTVTDPASRHLNFTYPSDTSRLVTGVSSDVGISLSYSYDNQGRLTQVTKQDQTTVNFTYNSQSLITAVTDSDGKVLESHTYDSSGRALTSSRAGGVEAVTLTYSSQ